MTDDVAASKCIVCISDINPGAKKCLKCNSRQDWLRYLDVGNTSISLLIAACAHLRQNREPSQFLVRPKGVLIHSNHC